MDACITEMDRMFRTLAAGECLQPLRSLMWLPDKSGILGMMPAFLELQAGLQWGAVQRPVAVAHPPQAAIMLERPG